MQSHKQDEEGLQLVTLTPEEEEEEEETNLEQRELYQDVSSLVDVRSQRLSDVYPQQQKIHEHGSFIKIQLEKLSSLVIQGLVHFLFPRVLNNKAPLFANTTKVELRCPWRCNDGHICQYVDNHDGSHVCVFGHKEEKEISKCGNICDCRNCEAICSLEPGHGGPHKCYFSHPLSDIPKNTKEQQAFRFDKAIGTYLNELVYASTEEQKFSQIPETSNSYDEQWTE